MTKIIEVIDAAMADLEHLEPVKVLNEVRALYLGEHYARAIAQAMEINDYAEVARLQNEQGI